MSFVDMKKALVDPFFNNNPITVQILGICSCLGSDLQPESNLGNVCGLNLSNGLFQHVYFPWCASGYSKQHSYHCANDHHRVLGDCGRPNSESHTYEVSKQLSVFVGLIITNCIVMGRAEAYAMSNGYQL